MGICLYGALDFPLHPGGRWIAIPGNKPATTSCSCELVTWENLMTHCLCEASQNRPAPYPSPARSGPMEFVLSQRWSLQGMGNQWRSVSPLVECVFFARSYAATCLLQLHTPKYSCMLSASRNHTMSLRIPMWHLASIP